MSDVPLGREKKRWVNNSEDGFAFTLFLEKDPNRI